MEDESKSTKTGEKKESKSGKKDSDKKDSWKEVTEKPASLEDIGEKKNGNGAKKETGNADKNKEADKVNKLPDQPEKTTDKNTKPEKLEDLIGN